MASQNKQGNASLLIILMVSLFLAILNQTLLNVAMPHLMTEFNVSATTIQWLTTGYMLVNGVLIPLSAFLIMRFGGRSLFLTAMLLFTIGTLICGISPNFSTMLIGRLIQAAAWRNPSAAGDDNHSVHFPSGKPRERNGNLRPCDDVRSGGRSDFIRLDHRKLRLADHVLRTRADWRHRDHLRIFLI